MRSSLPDPEPPLALGPTSVGSTLAGMFNVGGGEIVVVLLLALLVLGPDKLPEAARRIGSLVSQIRRVTSSFEEEVRSAIDLGSPSAGPDALDSTTAGPTLSGPPVTPPGASRPGAFVVDLGPATITEPDG